MNGKRTLILLAALLAVSTFAQNANNDKPVEETKKNIKVLKGMPTSQLIPVMAFMSNSLGVTCAHCHTKEWESDEIEAKDAARGMIAMVRDINERHFAGEQAITCNSCHQGHVRPPGVPNLADAGWNKKPEYWMKATSPPSVSACCITR